ncbi:MAG: ATP-binding protein [Sodaliphilus sp.]
MKFYNRENELNIIHQNEEQSYKSAVMMVLTGRRRVGKTSLIRKAMEGKEYAYLFVPKTSEALLCEGFQRELEEQIGLSVYGKISRFRDLFEVIMKESQKRHLTIVLDEFQTLYHINQSIFSEIQNIWDTYKDRAKIHLIASGSIQTLMKRIFEDQSEPLYGRPTSKMILRPFSTAVIREIMNDEAPGYRPNDLLCLYMLTGGVAKYIELLVDAKCLSKEKMLNYVCRQDSYFLTEGKDILNQEFSKEQGTYFSILQMIACGRTKRSEIDASLQKETGTYLTILESKFELIQRITPILAKSKSKTTNYEIRDHFLRFWFRFIHPYQALIETQQFDLLKHNITQHYNEYSGRILEQYFRDKLMESGNFTQVGRWWDRKGENEIDIIGINEFSHTGIVAEVKRNKQKIDLKTLTQKMEALPAREFSPYQLQTIALSPDDM